MRPGTPSMSPRRHATYRWSAHNLFLRSSLRRAPSAGGDSRLLCRDIEVGNRPLQAESTQVLRKQLRHSPVSIPLAIGAHDVPRRALGVAALQDCAVGLLVRRPLCTLVDIAGDV